MAYDYDVDILGALFTGGEENQEPYVSLISENGALTDEVSERRILSTIELLRSHMELIQTRDEGNLLHYALARMITHTAGGSDPFSVASARTNAIGNVKNPQFPAGSNVAITFDGTTIPATSASGGDCATVAAELNAFLDVPGTPLPEMSTVLVNVGDAEGSLGSRFFTLNSANDATNYYVWMEHATRAETTEITTIGDIDGDLAGTRFTINGSGGEEYYVWYSHDGIAEETEINVFGDTSGNRAELYFTLNSPAAAFYVWYSHDGIGETTDITLSADVDGSHEEEYFFIHSPTTQFYVWYSHDGIEETFTSTWTGINGTLPTTAVPGAYFDVDSTTVAHRIWFSNGMTTAPATGGRVLFATTTWTGAEANDIALAAVVAAEMILADVDFASAANGGTDIVTTTNAAVGSVVDIVDGTTGAAFAVSQQGLAVAETDPMPGGTGLEVMYSVNASADSLAEGTTAVVDGDAAFVADDLSPGVVTVTNAAIGPATNAEGGTVGFGVSITQQGLAVAETDPAPAGEGIEIMYSVNDSQATFGLLTEEGISFNAAFSATDDTEGLVTVTNAAIGIATDATVGTTEWGVSVTQQGLDPSETDPAPGVGVGLEVMYSVDAAASSIAEGTTPVIDAAEGLTAVEGGGALLITTTTAGGSVVDAADVDTGFTINVTSQGLDTPPDPAPFGLTGIPVAYTVGGDVTQGAGPSVISAAIASAIDANGDFSAIAEGATVFADNAADGPTTDLADGNLGFIYTVTQQGGDASDTIPVQAFCTLDNRLGFRSEVDFLSFSIANGTGGIIGPAGIIPGPRLSTPAKVANDGRNSATNYVSKKKRNNPLNG